VDEDNVNIRRAADHWLDVEQGTRQIGGDNIRVVISPFLGGLFCNAEE